MAYRDFTLSKIKGDIGIQIDEKRDLFAEVEPVAGSNLLNNTLPKTVQLAIANCTKKFEVKFGDEVGEAIVLLTLERDGTQSK